MQYLALAVCCLTVAAPGSSHAFGQIATGLPAPATGSAPKNERSYGSRLDPPAWNSSSTRPEPPSGPPSSSAGGQIVAMTPEQFGAFIKIVKDRDGV
jgi:hypothetical protein